MMVVQPSIEEHEALMNEVKALKEELKRVRNEKKETSRSPAEVELQPKTRDRKTSRNSWTDIYNETTYPAQTQNVLGAGGRDRRWAGVARQVGSTRGGVSCLLTLICFGAQQYIATIVFGALALIFFGILYYKNVSFVIAKRLLRETNVVIILLFSLCIWCIDIARPLLHFLAG